MTFRRTLAGAAVAALAFVLPGCQEPVTGIFHELAHQQPTVDRNLANDLTIGGIARWEDRYVVAAGKLWSRPVGTEDDPGEWVPMTATFDGDDKSAVMLPLVRWKPAGGGASLLAGALLDNECPDKCFALLQADGTQIRDDSVAWRTVLRSEVSGREVVGLFTPSDESVLFAVIAKSRGENRTYTLLSATDRSAGAPDFAVEIDDLSHPVQAVASDGSGTYWAVSGNDLYTGPLGGLRQSGTPSPEGSERFRGVIHGGSDTLILTGSKGTVWRSEDGGQTWDKKEIRAEDQAVPLWGAVAVRGTALIGTDAHGYYTASLDGDDDLEVERPKHTTKAIYDASILTFWVDPEPDGDKVFALTARDGLWTTRVNSGAVPEPERWELE